MNTDTEPSPSSPLQLWAADTRGDFVSRLASHTAGPIEDTLHVDWDCSHLVRSRSPGTSLAVQARSEYDLDSMASDPVPGLTRENSIASTSSEASTDMASVIDGGCTLESEDGVLTLPARFRPDANLVCPFRVLDCSQTFSDVVELKMHVFSHFRGHPLPPYAPCFICGQLFSQRPQHDNAWAWNNMLAHMAYEHYRGGDGDFTLKADIAVMRYMWNRKVITDAEFKRTQLEGSIIRARRTDHELSEFRPAPVPEAPISAPTPNEIRRHRWNLTVGNQDEPVTVSAGRRQDRRQAERARGGTRFRGNL